VGDALGPRTEVVAAKAARLVPQAPASLAGEAIQRLRCGKLELVSFKRTQLDQTHYCRLKSELRMYWAVS